jgi:hypothetical protein
VNWPINPVARKEKNLTVIVSNTVNMAKYTNNDINMPLNTTATKDTMSSAFVGAK